MAEQHDMLVDPDRHNCGNSIGVETVIMGGKFGFWLTATLMAVYWVVFLGYLFSRS